MSRHSKNNTALAFFTQAEKAKLNYGTQKQRLGRDSMRNFDACFLCLQRAREPLCCTEGHLSCKECMYENILSQKKELARQFKLYKEQQEQQEESRRQTELAAKEAELTMFEQTQTQFLPSMMREATDIGEGKKLLGGKVYTPVTTAEGTVYTYDSEGRNPRNASGEVGTKKPMEQSKDKSLPSFWIPSLTPDAKPLIIQAPKMETVCTASEKHHPVTVKKLVEVKFTLAKGNEDQYICPACLKTFTNGSKIVVLKTCGHTFCKGCCSRFVKPTRKCHQCEVKCKEKDIVELSGEGTGFVGSGGKVESSKATVAFQ
ncbi:uncharacterized protein SPPG_01346 [Spizellomyces punctatus DAOM BR117]|uniref:RING-type domain-containing protein n=1 Tax=Spizellomyces punctatus (strain DAOM BR117) TaxID=645134 RepID=A0A0L0HS29_SPIPD|nr:uncharacterized protein SPPG_01346 [Spizellomyces punctatus DAOM BR117]KND03892.1 hypothetical protein SPPG_01346 [Spizellomyces punctatus DAOM BR117]|eukprot:XP_016611931.1 hypothetical protein SPPG_01346 [Spizellomyces punctatus DAOM BR117]